MNYELTNDGSLPIEWKRAMTNDLIQASSNVPAKNDAYISSLASLPDDEFLDEMGFLIDMFDRGEAFAEDPTDENFEHIMEDIIQRKALDEILLFTVSEREGCEYLRRAYLRCKNLLSEEERWWLLLCVYQRNGYDFPKELIFEVLPFRPTDYLRELPSKYNDTDEIKVYRASTTSRKYPQKLWEELSWTVSPNVARDFYDMRLSMGQECFIYEGIIKKDDIIAVCGFGEGGQCEILQYRGVRDVKQISKGTLNTYCNIEELEKRFHPR